MKVLIAVHHFPPSFGGGAEWRAHRTAKGLQRESHQVQVVCVDSTSHGDGHTLDYADTLYDGIPVRRLHFNLAKAPDPFRWSYRNPLIGQHLAALLEEFEPDVLYLISGYLMTGSAIEAVQAAQVPIVLTLTDFWFLCPRITLARSDGSLCQVPADSLECVLCLCKERRRCRVPDRLSRGLLGRLLLWLWRKPEMLKISGFSELAQKMQERRDYLLSLLNKVDVVISPSQFLKGLFEAQGVQPHQFVYIRQGLDMQGWVPAELALANSRLRIGYIGQIAPHKGVNVLIGAFCRLRARSQQVQLLLYGDPNKFPNFAQKLRRQAEGRNDIIWAGWFDNAQIRSIHAGLDILVVPSIWYENSPTVILEAFALGTPVIASDLGGMAELVHHEVNGLLFSPGDEEALAQQLQRLVDRPAFLNELKQGISPVKTMQEEIAELIRVYQLAKGSH